tara:strand:+ start:3084 stop:3803 length:720 start_codon:yes stop_codon:yes gene_type:complete
VKLPEYYIMDAPLTNGQARMLQGQDGEDDSSLFNIDAGALKHIMGACNDGALSSVQGLDSDVQWEVRCPSEAEWRCADSAIGLGLEKKQIEVLADAVNSNYRGAMMDGRPRRFEGLGPMALHRAAIETHPSKEGITALSSVPLDRPIAGVVARLVITPIRQGAPKRVPESADMAANIRTELVCTLLLGVIPSFTIPVLRGMGDYVQSGWANLLFGGLCAGFVTGAFWRPRRPTITYDES